ncbi:MAG: hypothetical protein ACI8W8_003241 [Rhodothermales bacterium]
MTQPPFNFRLHITCSLLFGLGLVSSLWLFGHSGLTMMLILALPAMMLVPRWRVAFSHWRLAIRVVSAVAAVLWGVLRYTSGATVELVLVECVSILGFSCMTGTTRREYVYLGMVVMAQFAYGAVQPPRMAFILSVLGALPLAASLAYRYRSRLLSKGRDLPFHSGLGTAALMQVVLVILACAVVFSLFPSQPGPRFGLVYVTPLVNKPVAPSFRNWFNPSPQTQYAPDGERSVDGENADSIDNESTHLIRAANGQGMRGDGGDGGGGGGEPGGDLVFRVKAPSHLYLLGQLYDTYDGIEWHASKEFEETRFWPLGAHSRIPQQISVEKWVTRRLPLAYWPASLSAFDYKRALDRDTFYSFRLSDKELPQLPFHYTGWSWLAESSEKVAWSGDLPPSHFTALPDLAISDRLRTLAESLITGVDDPYARAILLRDHLRNTYEYELYSKKLPPGREAADYFLFELKAGHCEYFASALTVLARLSDLPARVAVGFSPGKYNPLTGSFDVYEYHAHAWTQIFVPQHGWLTMDASPPADIRVERKASLPFLSDPFTDDWKVTSPEQAREVRNFSRAQDLPEFQLPEWLEARKPEKPKDRLTALMQIRNSAYRQLSPWDRMKAALIEIGERLRGYWELLLAELSGTLILQLFIIIIGANMLVFLLPGFRAQWRRRMQRRRCLALHAIAWRAVEQDAASAIRACYQLLRELLSLHGYEKAGGQELEDYGAGAVTLASGISQPVRAVFRAYSRCEYGPFVISAREAARVLEDTESVLEKLRHQ